MSKRFESEIRILIEDIDGFLIKLEKLNAKMNQNYKFTDYIYIPKNPTSDWNLNQKIMRIRNYLEPEQYSRILFTENEVIQGNLFQFKQSKYPQGKVELYRGDRKTAEDLLLAWDFRLYFKIEKENGKLYEIVQPKTFIIAVEKIIQLGYSAEIEVWGENLGMIENEFLDIITLLEIPMSNISSNTLPFIVAKHLNLLD